MAELNTRPGSSTPKQRSTLVIVGKRRGLELAKLRETVGGSLRGLSAADASKWIEHFSGQQLPNPPGEKPSPYGNRPQRTAATRMIHPDHVEHIERLLVECFGDQAAGLAWLKKDFKARHPRDLLTAKRAGQVIRVLKGMIDRRRSGGVTARQTDVEHEESGSMVGV